MPKPGIELDGIREFRRSVSDVRRRFPDEMKEVHGEIAIPMASQAAGKVRVLTGRYKDSIKPKYSKTMASVTFGGSKVPYAGPHHYGGYPGDWAGDPVILQTHEQNKERNLAKYADAIQQLLNREF